MQINTHQRDVTPDIIQQDAVKLFLDALKELWPQKIYEQFAGQLSADYLLRQSIVPHAFKHLSPEKEEYQHQRFPGDLFELQQGIKYGRFSRIDACRFCYIFIDRLEHKISNNWLLKSIGQRETTFPFLYKVLKTLYLHLLLRRRNTDVNNSGARCRRYSNHDLNNNWLNNANKRQLS